MAEDLLETVGQLFGPVRGGLAYAVVLVGALLAATTGVVAASVISMGLISLPIMLRYGYDRRVATGIIAASGTLAQIIPPSLVLIVMADQLGRSVGDMYEGALIPGPHPDGPLSRLHPAAHDLLPEVGAGPAGRVALARVGSRHRCSSMLVRRSSPSPTARRPISMRMAAPTAASGASPSACSSPMRWHSPTAGFELNILSRLTQQVIIVLIPPLALIFLVLGTIFLGIATPTEGGAMGAVGALALALAKRRLTLEIVRQALASTTRLSAFVMFILIGARVFSLTFYGVNGHIWVEHLLSAAPGGEIGFLIVVNLLVFVLAFFLDFFELAFIIVPLLAPVAEKLGIDLIWFGVLLSINLQTSFMHPPFGFSLFYLRSVAPRETYIDKLTGETHRAGEDLADLLGRRALRVHPDHHGRAVPRLPADGHALQERSSRRRRDQQIVLPPIGGGGLSLPGGGLQLPSGPPGSAPAPGTSTSASRRSSSRRRGSGETPLHRTRKTPGRADVRPGSLRSAVTGRYDFCVSLPARCWIIMKVS